MKSTFHYPDSTDKLLHQIQAVARKSFDDGRHYFAAPRAVRVSALIYRKYGCYLHCGGCCSAFTLDYLPDEWERFAKHFPQYAQDGKERSIAVNGRKRPIVTIYQDRAIQRFNRAWCQYLDPDTAACKVHQQNPLSCRIELIKLQMVSGVGHIMKKPFGRAWNMSRFPDGVKDIRCDFSDFDAEQFHNNDVPALEKMFRWANYLSIETYLPAVLEHIYAEVENSTFRAARFTGTSKEILK